MCSLALNTQTILARLVGVLIAVGVAILGFFLFTTFLAVTAVVFVAGLLRLWWNAGRMPRPRAETISVEYERVDDEVHEPDAILPPSRVEPR